MMRGLLVKVCISLMAITLIQACEDGGIPVHRDSSERAISSCFLKFHGTTILELIRDHFQVSMDYLLTSKQYGSQYVQRPGMSKFLAGESDRHWEEGMDVLKKFFQRGGSNANADPNFIIPFQLKVNPQLEMTEDNMGEKYVDYLKTMLGKSKNLAKSLTLLYHRGGKSYNGGGDAEFSHYFSDKIEKEVDVIRDLAGHINTLDGMKELGVAISAFDSNL